jgi:hypothetical protein
LFALFFKCYQIFKAAIPWDSLKCTDIYHKVVEEHETLYVDFNLIPLPFSRIIKDGFSLNTMQRMSFDEVKTLLESFQLTLISTNKRHVVPKKPIRTTNNNNSFSEGIVDIKEMVTNENEISATMNTSIEELDKFSQFSSNSNINGNSGGFIYCDAYKTEVHLTNKMNSRSRSLNPRTHSKSNHAATKILENHNNKNMNKKKYENDFLIEILQ